MNTTENNSSRNDGGVFDELTNKYALSKTLRFELRPVGKTLENMRTNLGYDEGLHTFLKDQNLEDAYRVLKPVFDTLHENFITKSLESERAKKFNASDYLAVYRKRHELGEKYLAVEEKKLRSLFDDMYKIAASDFIQRAGNNEKGKPVLKEKGYKVLTEAGILEYIAKNVNDFSEVLPEEKIQQALLSFKGFFTYFSGFNQNRENYYTTKDEKATAVATRVVHENLPKFCDNVITFEQKKNEYLNIYKFLRDRGRILEAKDKVTKKIVPLKEISADIFSIKHFSACLSQSQIEKYNEEIGNANYLINLYNQAIQKDDNKKLAYLKTLYKQVGCGKGDAFFFALTHDKKSEAETARAGAQNVHAYSVEEVLSEAARAGEKYFKELSDNEILRTVPDLLRFLKTREDFQGIYWSKQAINTISNKYFADWRILKERLKIAKVFPKAAKESEEDVRTPDVVELESLFVVLNATEDWRTPGVLFRANITEAKEGERGEENTRRHTIIQRAQSPSTALVELLCNDIEKYAQSFVAESENVLVLGEYTSDTSKEIIKQWLDNALVVTQMIKYFNVRKNKIKGTQLDSVLSEGLDVLLWSDDVDWFRRYDAVRNYLTKKPQDDAKENKLKLNFENSTLAGGWDLNKEKDNFCVILSDENGKQFLAITTKNHKGIFEKEKVNGKGKMKTVETSELFQDADEWKKMEYKLLPGPNKMLPKCLLPKSDLKKYGATEKVLQIYQIGSFKKGEDTFSKQDLHILIDFYKSALEKYTDWECFGFVFQKTESYEDISQFYSDVEKQGYKLDFIPINGKLVNTWVEEGKIYLFEIRNQDSNTGKCKGHKKNLHTLYWNAVFANVPNRPKLNGEAEIFYRKAVPTDALKIVQWKGKEIVQNYRFSKDTFVFHVPITLNFCAKDNRINDAVNKRMEQSTNVYFLGIDRGEKHLAYYSLVDGYGNIREQGTLNIPFLDSERKQRTVKVEKRIINSEGIEEVKLIDCRDYNELLEVRAGNREYARKNWKTIGTIKELKEGYISQVVRKIVDIAVANNAYIVLENLNIGFKRGRQKIEKSVYQKLELALAKKLNFLVDKSATLGEFGSVTRALQLTPRVTNFGDMDNRSQFGIMLYTRANYTSQTDPLTGWRKSIYLKKGSEENIKKQILDTFSEIMFDGKDYVFTYVEVVGKEGRRGREWSLYSSKDATSLDRFRGRKGSNNEWVIERCDVRKMLDELFVNMDKNRSILTQIREGVELVKNNDDTAWGSLRYAIELIQQIRNTGVKADERNADFLLSPVRDKKSGTHFDSREYWDRECAGEHVCLPSSGDANGAYNIARKGIVMSEHMRRGWKLYISDEEWDAWLTGPEAWEQWAKRNEKNLVWKKNN